MTACVDNNPVSNAVRKAYAAIAKAAQGNLSKDILPQRDVILNSSVDAVFIQTNINGTPKWNQVADRLRAKKYEVTLEHDADESDRHNMRYFSTKISWARAIRSRNESTLPGPDKSKVIRTPAASENFRV